MGEPSLFIVFFPSLILSQYYNVTAFQAEYDEIVDYNSIFLETGGVLNWDYEFQLDFTFPYFDEEFNKIICYDKGICEFEGNVDFSMQLMAFDYIYDIAENINNIDSDVRFKLTNQDGLKALVMQFTKMRLDSDPSVEQYDSNINFQYWFFENGTIEVRFGPRNLSNSPNYVPGEGFYLITPQGPILLGPLLTIIHPFETEKIISYANYDNGQEYEVNMDRNGIVRTLPPEGWVVRFENLTTSNSFERIYNNIKLFPNPSKNRLYVEGVDNLNYRLEIISASCGKKVKEVDGNFMVYGYIDVQDLEQGLYIINIHFQNTVQTYKHLKID